MRIFQTGWLDYELLDVGNGKKLERYGDIVVERPAPGTTGAPIKDLHLWQPHARFVEENKNWQFLRHVPQTWPVHWQDLTFTAECAPYKHMGIFPEQSAHWQWMRDVLMQYKTPSEPPHVLNLFAYTGCASVVAAHTGARVTHVDSSRAVIGMAKKNQASSGLSERSIRWILDDVTTFVGREVRRGVRYDGIILDPPAFGHGPRGERWQLQRSLPELLSLCKEVLSDAPLFVLINIYTGGLSPKQMGAALQQVQPQRTGVVTTGELCLQTKQGERQLSTGVWGRWQAT